MGRKLYAEEVFCYWSRLGCNRVLLPLLLCKMIYLPIKLFLSVLELLFHCESVWRRRCYLVDYTIQLDIGLWTKMLKVFFFFDTRHLKLSSFWVKNEWHERKIESGRYFSSLKFSLHRSEVIYFGGFKPSPVSHIGEVNRNGKNGVCFSIKQFFPFSLKVRQFFYWC